MKKVIGAIFWLVALDFLLHIVIVPLWGLLTYLNWASNDGLFSFIAGIIIIGIILAWCRK